MQNEILQQVLELQAQLRPIDEETLRIAMYYPEQDGWSFCDYYTRAGYDACFMDTIGDWQVIRTVSVSTCVSFDGEDVENWEEYEKCCQKFDEDGDDAHEFDYNCMYEGDFQQIWINVHSGLVIEFKRPRVRRNGPPTESYYYALDQDWCEPIVCKNPCDVYPIVQYSVPICARPEKRKYPDTIADYLIEENLHEVLKAQGYDPAIGEDMERRLNGEYSIMEHSIVQFIVDFINNANHERDIMQFGGVEMYYKTHGDNADQFIAACRIARRHKYVVAPENRYRYTAYLESLVYLGKDLHNPFYICPQDFDHAFRHIERLATRKRDAERREREREYRERYPELLAQQQQANQERIEKLHQQFLSEEDVLQAYAERMAQYAHIKLNYKSGIQVMVCPTYDDMWEEGSAMHHCVGYGAGGYHKKLDSLIMFVRDANGERISTIEYSISKGKVLQNRGLGNEEPPYFDDINALVEAHAAEWRHPERVQNTPETNTATLQIKIA